MPNVLLITADQWRADCLGCAGHPVVQTPNIDLIATEGVRFARHYAQAAPCSPARACLYTGLYQMTNRVVFNGTPLDRRHLTIAQSFRALGYDPTLFGYTDIGVDPRTTMPLDPWLRTYEGILPGMSVRVHLPDYPGQWLSWLRSHGHDIPLNWKDLFLPLDESGLHVGKPPKFSAAETQTAYLVDEFGKWLGEQRGPWFAHLSFLSPHPPFAVPEPYASMYSVDDGPDFVRPASRDGSGLRHPYLAFANEAQRQSLGEPEERQMRATYWGMVSEVDAQIGRVREILEAAGQWDDTIFVLTSDHGEQLGDHHLWGKLGFFDQSFHVPLIIRAPGGESGRVVTDFSESIDLFPTMLDLAGAAVPTHLDGRSLKAYVVGEEVETPRSEAHFEFDFRDFVHGHAMDVLGLDLDNCSLAVYRDASFKYVHFAGLPPVLFDLGADPFELEDVADDPSYLGIRLAYAEKLLSWRARHLDRQLTGLALTDKGVIDGRAR
jgi:arylsulfatase A-like enzyme